MKAIIIEDELNVREGFIKLLNTFCPEVEVVGVADSVETGLDLINSSTFDVLFLDINLPDGSGFDIIHRLEKKDFDVIFVTAYNQYALNAFKVSAIDYLLKPIAPDLLINAISKVKNKSKVDASERLSILDEKLSKSYSQTEKIILKDADIMQIVVISDIIYCEAKGSYTTFFLDKDRQMLTSLHLKEYERILEPYGFIRNHHSFMINLHQVESLQRSEGGTIVMKNGKRLPLSTRKKPTVIEALKKRFVN